MGDTPSSSPQQQRPAQLEYGVDGVTEPKSTLGSKLALVMVWGLGLVSWVIWAGIILWLFVKFLM